ncbi:MAG: hypothetical protein M3Z37_11090, partial [Candidatus Eremiobacteraeota bacterium]|nr:hypothetical protein [Candidatus Eremiobacteraeota bacterium]
RSSNLGIACAVGAFLWVPFIHSVVSMLPTFILFSIAMSLARPGLQSRLTAEAPENQRGTILGVSSALDNLSGLTMPPLSTGLLGKYGPGWAGVVSAFFAVIALCIGILAQRREGPFVQPVTTTDRAAEAAAK